jgi:hypothetical protein
MEQAAQKLSLEERNLMKTLVSDRLRIEPGPIGMLRVGYGVTANGGFVMFLWDKSGRVQALQDFIMGRAKVLTGGRVGGRYKNGHVTVGRILSLPYSKDPVVRAAQQRAVLDYVKNRAVLYENDWKMNLTDPARKTVHFISRATVLHEAQWLTLRGDESTDVYYDGPSGTWESQASSVRPNGDTLVRSEVREVPGERLVFQWNGLLSDMPEPNARSFWQASLEEIHRDLGRSDTDKILIERILKELDPLRIDPRTGMVTAYGYSVASFFDPENATQAKVVRQLSEKQLEIVRRFGADKVVLVPSGYDPVLGRILKGQSSFHITLEGVAHDTGTVVPREELVRTAELLKSELGKQGIIRGKLVGPFWHKSLAIVMIWVPEANGDPLLEAKKTVEHTLGRPHASRPFHLTLAYPKQGEFTGKEFREEYARMEGIPVTEIPVTISRFEVNGYADSALIDLTREQKAVIDLNRSEARLTDAHRAILNEKLQVITDHHAARSEARSSAIDQMGVDELERELRFLRNATEETDFRTFEDASRLLRITPGSADWITSARDLLKAQTGPIEERIPLPGYHRSEMRMLPMEVAAAAKKLFDHLAVSSTDLPKDPVVVVLGNPLEGYPAYVAKALTQLKPSKVLIVGNGVKPENRKTANNPKGTEPEWQRIQEALIKIDPLLKDKILVDPSDQSMNTGQNVVPAISILNRNGLFPQKLVLVQVPQGLLVSQRIFEKQWSAVEAKTRSAATYVFSVRWLAIRFWSDLVRQGGLEAIRRLGSNLETLNKHFTPIIYTHALSEYVAKVKEFLRTGNAAFEVEAMHFQKRELGSLQGLLKDIIGQIYRLRTWNEWGEGFIRFHDNDLSNVVLENEAVLSRYLGSSPLSFTQGNVVLREFGLTDHALALVVVDRGFEKSPLGPMFRSSRSGFDRVNNEISVDKKPITDFVKDQRVNNLKVEPAKFPELLNQGETTPPQPVSMILPNGNLGMNDWFVGITDGKVYHYRGDELAENRRYDMLIVMKNGETKIMTLHFTHQKARGIFDESGKNIAAEIQYGIYGQHIFKGGHGNLDEAAVQFDDMRHLLRFPMFKRGKDQIHLGFSDHKGELYEDVERKKARAALKGEAVELDLSPLNNLKTPVTGKERDVVFGNWGYRNVTGQSGKDQSNLEIGEYWIEGNSMWIRFRLGTHPHSFFGIVENRRTHERKIVAGVVLGKTHEQGATLDQLPLMVQEALIQQKKTKDPNDIDILQDLFLGGNGKDTYMQEGKGVTKIEGAYGRGFSAVMVVEKTSAAKQATDARSEVRGTQTADQNLKLSPSPVLSLRERDGVRGSEIDTSSLGAKIGTAIRVAADTVSPLLSGSPAYASEIAPELFAGTVHYQKAAAVPATFAAKWPVLSKIINPPATAFAERMVIDQRQGIPDAASVLPLVTFARYNPKTSVVMALIADARSVARFEKELTALNQTALPANFKVRAFSNEKEFVEAFAGFYNSAAPNGNPVALITDREDSVVTRKIGSRRHLLSVVGAQDPLKQTASALLAADKLLDESIWSMGYHFVSVEKLGGLEALMADLTKYVAAQAKVMASA